MNPERIAFALRGFQNTYNLFGCNDELESIVLRHDSSGQYPLSAPDFPSEQKVLNLGRLPLDGLYTSISKGFPELKVDADSSPTSTPSGSTRVSKTNTPTSVNFPLRGADSELKIPETSKKTEDARLEADREQGD